MGKYQHLQYLSYVFMVSLGSVRGLWRCHRRLAIGRRWRDIHLTSFMFGPVQPIDLPHIAVILYGTFSGHGLRFLPMARSQPLLRGSKTVRYFQTPFRGNPEKDAADTSADILGIQRYHRAMLTELPT